jgi:hypothetical protein
MQRSDPAVAGGNTKLRGSVGLYSGGLAISCCAVFLPVRFAMRGVTQGARSARSPSWQQCAHARLPHCVLYVVGADRMNTSPSVEARQLPGKILAAFLGGRWVAVRLHKVCAWPAVGYNGPQLLARARCGYG